MVGYLGAICLAATVGFYLIFCLLVAVEHARNPGNMNLGKAIASIGRNMAPPVAIFALMVVVGFLGERLFLE